jgi:two-component sensor histidine kinase
VQWEALQAELLIPILAKNALVGLLAVGPKLSRVAYSREDQLALLTLANQTAVAIENARLYGAVQRELAERERVEKQILESLHEKEVLLKEIHHRVKNNLQVVSSLLSLQMRYAAEERTVDVLRDSQMRIHSMALIHEKLYQSANLADVDVGEYVRSLAVHLKRTYSGGATAEVAISVEVPPVRLGIDAAVPCALIINELITNALKHAFHNHPGRGAIIVRGCVLTDGRLELEVADNGVGMPAGINIGDPATLGMRLIRSLIQQLDGDIAMSNDRGAVVRLRFPIPPPPGDES